MSCNNMYGSNNESDLAELKRDVRELKKDVDKLWEALGELKQLVGPCVNNHRAHVDYNQWGK